jgi:hypothetical protein
MTARAALLAVAVLLAACRSPEPEPPGQPIPQPSSANVERVVFVVGDAGEARATTHPILAQMRDQVEHWARTLDRDSSVVVLVVGDIIYPNGMHEPSDREDFPRDSAIVTDQLAIVSGPVAREHHVPIYFLAGNHDWGSEQHEEGVATLANLDEFLGAHRSLGINARLLPAAGEAGPDIVDMGSLRFIFLDTAWWLLQTRGEEEDRLVNRIEYAVRTADDRHVVVVAHHPFVTAGPHGGELPLFEGLGVGFLLKRAGAILQDMNSPPYRRLRTEVARIFEANEQPLLWAAGHEHSLQLHAAQGRDEPRWSMVSGSASKITHVAETPGMRFRLSAPGYFMLLVRTDGSVDAVAVAAPVEDAVCEQADDAARAACMAAGVAAFQPRFSQRLTE